jgi:hypothetical protein
MLHLAHTPMYIDEEQVRDAISILINRDIAGEITYEVKTCETIGTYKVWFISINPDLENTKSVRRLIEYIKNQGFHLIYTNRYWRVSVV